MFFIYTRSFLFYAINTGYLVGVKFRDNMHIKTVSNDTSLRNTLPEPFNSIFLLNPVSQCIKFYLGNDCLKESGIFRWRNSSVRLAFKICFKVQILIMWRNKL